MTANDIQLMLDIDDALLLHPLKLSNWERDLLKTIRDRLNRSKKVSDKQVNLANKILQVVK